MTLVLVDLERNSKIATVRAYNFHTYSYSLVGIGLPFR